MNTEQEHSEIPTTFSDWREARRFRAWQLHEKGWNQARIAEALGVTEGAVSQWFRRVREAGVAALTSRRNESGRKPGLTVDDLQKLVKYLSRGPAAYGFRGEVWTQGRVRAVIAKEFGIMYTQRHVGRLLQQIKWTRQKPVERADQRDEQAVAEWQAESLPDLKKKPNAKGAPSSS